MKRFSTLLTFAIAFFASIQANAGKPSIRRIDSAKIERSGGPNGAPLLIVRGEGLAGISSISIGTTDLNIFLPTSDEISAVLPKLPDGHYRVHLQWGRFVSEPKELCSPNSVTIGESGCVLDAVHFATGSDVLDTEALQTIQKNAVCIIKSGQTRVLLLGFESKIGKTPGLAQRRADRVKSSLETVLKEKSSENTIKVETNGLWKQLPTDPSSSDAASQRVMFAIPEFPNFIAPRLVLDADRDFNAEAKALLTDSLVSLQRQGVTAVLLVFPRTVNGSVAKKPERASETMRNAVQEAAASAGLEEGVRYWEVYGDKPENVLLVDRLLSSRGPSLTTEQNGKESAAYLYPLQWIAQPNGATAESLDSDASCPSEATDPEQTTPVDITPCVPCEPKVIFSPEPTAKAPRGFLQFRFGGLKMFDNNFFGGSLRSGAFFGKEGSQGSVAIDLAYHYIENGYTLPSGELVHALITPSLAIGYTATWPTLRLNGTVVAGMLLPAFSGFMLDFDLSVGYRITPTFEMFASFQPGAGLAIPSAPGAEGRIQFTIGTMVGFP